MVGGGGVETNYSVKLNNLLYVKSLGFLNTLSIVKIQVLLSFSFKSASEACFCYTSLNKRYCIQIWALQNCKCFQSVPFKRWCDMCPPGH